jgi:hypothetical protein
MASDASTLLEADEEPPAASMDTHRELDFSPWTFSLHLHFSKSLVVKLRPTPRILAALGLRDSQKKQDATQTHEAGVKEIKRAVGSVELTCEAVFEPFEPDSKLPELLRATP